MPTTDQAIAITLPSLIHRIGSDTVKRLKLQAQTFDCELKRIRRSRNWQLLGEAASMQNFVVIPKPPLLAVVIVPRGFCPKMRPC